MQVVCEATQCQYPLVQVAAFEVLVRIMSIYYEHMQPYMERALFAVPTFYFYYAFLFPFIFWALVSDLSSSI